jgi:hypothetical protein
MLSRESFNEKFQVVIKNLAKEAFQRMDVQLDLRLEVLDALGEFLKETIFHNSRSSGTSCTPSTT